MGGWSRRAVLASSRWLAMLAGGWALLLFITGGFNLTLSGASFTTHEPLRPLLIAAVMASVYVLAGGAATVQELQRMCDRLVGALCRIDERIFVGVMAGALLIATVTFGTFVCGGSDSYGYVSEIGLWLRGNAIVAQPWATQVPWPDGIGSFSPLGYVAKGPDALVPTYPAGLPMLMAAAQWIAGDCGPFWVGPILAAMFVVFTWLLGRRLGLSRGGVMAAWLVATSTPMLFMVVAPLTDVPVAAIWTVAWYFVLGSGAWSAGAAGLAAGLASLVRPNLAPLCGVLVLWKLYQVATSDRDHRGQRLREIVAMSAGLLPGALAVLGINNYLYGSPFTTGYGIASGYFAMAHIWPNVKNYWSWFIQTETPIAVLGLIALVAPLKSIWPRLPSRAPVLFGALFVVGLWAQYQAFLVFDAWWYIRFLLPCWPLILIGTVAALQALSRPGRSIATFAMIVLVFWMGVHGVRSAAEHGAFESWRGERKYASVGLLAAEVTGENSVLLSMLHSGSIRYYGGRVTMRYEYLQAERVDQDLAWLAGHGAHPYAVLEQWEADDLAKRLAGTKTGARLLEPPLVRYDGSAAVLFFDLAPGAPQAATRFVREDFSGPRCVPAAPLPQLVLR